MLDARFSQLYFGPSLNTLQRGLPANAGLLVKHTLEVRTCMRAHNRSIVVANDIIPQKRV